MINHRGTKSPTGQWTKWAAGGAGMLLVTALAGGAAAQASDPLLNTLIKKGILTEDEARSIKAEADASQSNYPVATPSKWKISNGIKDIELYGDLRLRFEDRSARDPNGGSIDLQRLRYALRVGLRGEVLDNFYYGFRMDTAANPRSAWVTFGTASASGTGQYQGPFGKSTAGINVGQLYLGWRPEKWVDIELGKMPNPLYTTPMVWDTDFSPEGAAERFKYTVGEADFFATFGQFIYQDTNPNQSSPGYFNTASHTSQSFLLAWQLGLKYNITSNFSFKVAPVLYNYTGHGANSSLASFNPDYSGTFIGQGTSIGVGGAAASSSGIGGPYDGFVDNQSGINDLMIIEVPFELNFRIKDYNLRLFGDYAQNLDGANRAQDAFVAQQSPLFAGTGLVLIPSPQKYDNRAYQVGLAIGNKDSLGLVYGTTSKKHAWELRTYWQHVEQYALDPNLLDSDYFEGRGNLQGIYAAFAYGLTDNLTASLRYGQASRINSNLGTGGNNQDIPQMNPINRYEILQLDLGFKF